MPDTPGVAVDAAHTNGHARPPKDGLVRADARLVLRAADEEQGDGRTLEGHFSVFDQWTEIDSFYEGQFMERVAKGAFRKTFREQREQLRVLLQHGMDPQLGDRPIGEILDLREDDVGAYYKVRLFESVPDLVMDGLRAGQYGASFRFSVTREEWKDDAEPSEDNPRGLPERTLKEVSVREFGPVTWGAYPTATAGLRSFSDEIILARATREPERLRSLLEYLKQTESNELHSSAAPEQEVADTSQDERIEVREDEAAQAVIETAETGAPGKPTPLYFGKSRKATPGSDPTSLYIGKNRKRKAGWL